MREGDSAPKKAGIPSWQQASATTEEKQQQSTADLAAKPNESIPQSGSEGEQPPNDGRIEQGRRFLLDESVRNAPLEQRKSFLEAKGLSSDEIEKAVDLSRQADVNNAQEASPAGSQPQSFASQFEQQQKQQQGGLQSPTSSQPQQSTSQVQRNNDIPPIITYPEHLLRAQKPPPLVTWSRLLNTAYAATAVTAALYGCSKYLINPMVETLTEARHDFAAHSQEHLDEMNKKLSAVISVDPNARGGWKRKQEAAVGERYKDSAGEDEAEDPTELFHRDFGTQTSPDLLEGSTSDTSSSDGEDSKSKNDPNLQALKLQNLTAYCTSLSSDDLIDSTEDQSTLTVMRVLKDYLESLAYPSYSNAGVYGGGSSSSSTTGGKKEETESDKFKSEIRGIKGTLLSARNFPSGRGRGTLGTRGGGDPSRGGAGGPRSTMFPPSTGTSGAESAA